MQCLHLGVVLCQCLDLDLVFCQCLPSGMRPCTAGKYTVPVLWDKKTNTIVNNESAEIVRMLNERMNKLAKNVRFQTVSSSTHTPFCN